MKDRSLLLLLVVTTTFIFYVKPARENIELLKTRIMVVDAQIAAQEANKLRKSEIDSRVKTTGMAASRNEAYLYPADMSVSLALVDLQEFIKSSATANHLEIVTSTWGEPVADPTVAISKIPMSFSFRGVPADVDAFMQKVMYGRHLIKIDRATVSRYQDQQLLLSLSLVAFKRESRP